MAKLSGPKRPCSNKVPKTNTGLLLLVNVSYACREGQRPVRASCNCASASWRPAAVTFMDGFVRRAISIACVKVNCSVGSENRGAVWEFAVVENGPPLPRTIKHNETVANFFDGPFKRIGVPAKFLPGWQSTRPRSLRPADAETSSSDTSL